MNPWGRPRRNDYLQDFQALAFWLVLIGVVGFLLFPGFFQDVWSRLTMTAPPLETTEPLDPNQSTLLPQLPSVYQEVYGSEQLAELSGGYWAVFVRDGQFEQMALSTEGYSFLLGIIEKDRGSGTQKIILVANGQARQVLVSEEAFQIINQLSIIGDRNRSP